MATESWVVAGPQVIEVEDVRSLRVQVIGGRVDVVGQDGPSARLEVHSVQGRPIEVTLCDGELRIGYADTLSTWESFLDRLRTFRSNDRADVHVAVPRTAAVRIGTVSAEGLLAAVGEDASVGTVSGALLVDDTRGQLVARTVSGDVVVRGHHGPLTLNSVSGDLAASGELTAVHVNTVSGSVTLDVTSTTSSLSATTVSGDVTVRLPSQAGLQVKAQSVSGRLVVDQIEHKGPGFGTRTVDQSSGDGGCYLSATSVSGDVTVLRGVTA
ncbi:MAG: DUF4097 domain-containing protein [Actinobacteria bacterium]|nr:DUF4097 domain-containing protein [Actinomycetota bacterium]MCG2800550.1 DUF4097 domain-containing protein [Cellulomonas sp.]